MIKQKEPIATIGITTTGFEEIRGEKFVGDRRENNRTNGKIHLPMYVICINNYEYRGQFK